MSYIEKCTEKRDLLFNKLKPSRNIIVFTVSENCYHAYTLNDLKQFMAASKNHYIVDKLETFFYLPNGIRIDSSLSNCFENKANTMKLIESKNKFYIGIEANKQYYSYYSVEAIPRKAINSDEESTFDSESTNDPNLQSDTESDNEIDSKELEKQRNIRINREAEQLTNQAKKIGRCDEIALYGNGIECDIVYQDGNKESESWSKDGKLHRENELPAKIEYWNDGTIKREQWYINGEKFRNNNLPVEISYFQNGIKRSEDWFNCNQLHSNNDLPASIAYNEDSSKRWEMWYNYGRQHRGDDLPAYIFYFRNGSKCIEEWYVNGLQHRNNNPAYVEYNKDGLRICEKYYVNGVVRPSFGKRKLDCE